MATRCTTTSNRFWESYRCPAWRISDASSSKPKGATPDLSRRHWSTPTSYGQESEGMSMTGGISWITTRWNGDKGRPSWDGRTASSARPMKGQWAMRSYIHSWEAAKSPMSIRSNGWNVHLTTYTPASQRTNSQSYCLVTSFETRRVSDGYCSLAFFFSFACLKRLAGFVPFFKKKRLLRCFLFALTVIINCKIVVCNIQFINRI